MEKLKIIFGVSELNWALAEMKLILDINWCLSGTMSNMCSEQAETDLNLSKSRQICSSTNMDRECTETKFGLNTNDKDNY